MIVTQFGMLLHDTYINLGYYTEFMPAKKIHNFVFVKTFSRQIILGLF